MSKNLNISIFRYLGKALKPILERTIYRPGNIATILRGPSRGLKYYVYPEFGLAHIYGGWEQAVFELLDKVIKKGQTVYDLGANYGLYSLLMARKTGMQGSVFAFEPVPSIMENAKKNRDLNKFNQITIVNKAISNYCGKTEFIIGHHEGAGHLSTAGRGAPGESLSRIEVETTTIDDFVAEGHPPPDLIKIDIEGAESAALEGGRKTITANRTKLMIELHTPEQDLRVGALLQSFGYHAFRVDHPGLPRVKYMDRCYPDPDGIQGYIFALHDSQIKNDAPMI